MKIKNITLFMVFGLLSLNTTDLYAKKLSEIEIIEINKEKMIAFSRYEKVLNIPSCKIDDKETALELVFNQLNMKLEDIDHAFYSRMQEEIKELRLITKNLSQCNKKNPEIIAMNNNIKFYNSNISKFISFCKKHKNFIQGYQTLNFYENIQSDKNHIVQWVCNKINRLITNKSFVELLTGERSNFFVYPLISYKDKVARDLAWIKKNQNFDYGNLIKKINKIKQSMYDSSISLQNTNEYRIELQEQRKAALNDALNGF